MVNAALITVHPHRPHSFQATQHIATFLESVLRLPMYDHDPGDPVPAYDTLLMVNGPPSYCSWREGMAKMVRAARRTILIQNDYLLHPMTQVEEVWRDEKKVVESWSTIPYLPERLHRQKRWNQVPLAATHYVNWNTLPYVELPFLSEAEIPKQVLYYGAYRAGREDALECFFGSPSPYPVAISCTARTRISFVMVHTSHIELPVWHGLEELQRLGCMTIYLQDDFSTETYTSPATRFYECLGAGVAMVFARNSVRSFEIAGYDVSPYVVDTAADVARFFPYWKDIREEQRNKWAADYRGDLERRVRFVAELEGVYRAADLHPH